MFWGLVLEPGKRYAQTVDTAFHVSMACLEAKPSDNELTSVILDHNDREFILCSLQRQKFLQSQLDLNFTSGEKIAFLTSGQGKVHLTGYLIEQDDDDDDDDEDFEMPEDAESAGSLSEKLAGKLAESAKRKKKQTSAKEDPKKQKLSNAADDDESDFPSSDGEGDDSDDLVDSGDSESDEDEGGEEDEEEDEDSDEDDSPEVAPGKKKAESSPFSSAGSTPFHKKLQGKEKQISPVVQKGVKSPKPTPTASHKKEKTPVTGHMNVSSPNFTEGTPGEKSGKKKKNKNKGADSVTNTPGQNKNLVANITPAKTPKQTLTGGVVIEENKMGNGALAKQGSYVTVYYTGRLKHNNKQFDSVNEGTGFKFRLGGNEVIRGWDIGIPGMKVGGKRKITIPPQMAYGSKGAPPDIPPNSSLVFEVELRNVK